MLICIYSLLTICFMHLVNCQLLRPDLMNLGSYNPETKKYEKTLDTVHQKAKLGGDDHDYKHHKKVNLGGDDHDYKPHKYVNLGGDDHDYKPHKNIKFGDDDHDYKLRNKINLGGDDHDYKPHKNVKLGRDDHDYKPHKKVILGGGDHDYKPHKKGNLGGDDHDYRLHKRVKLGGDDHDYKLHKKSLFGNDGHDYKRHRKALLGIGDHDFKLHRKNLLGGGDHDYKLHKKIPLKDHHIYKHHKKILGRNLKARPHLESFQHFVDKFNRLYKTKKEFLKRFQVFRTNMKKMKLLQQNEMGSAKYGITKFADLTLSEFGKLLGLRSDLKSEKTRASHMVPAEIPEIKTPDEFDWRDKDVVTEVKNQGSCGSCWAFSVTGNVEGQWALKHKQLYFLSEQELVDCDSEDKGCEGGLPENAYRAIEELGGLETEAGYPYEGKDDKCALDPQKIKVQVNGSVELPEDEDKMKRWLVKNGPISIGINANALQFYVGGVSHPFRFLCNPESLDHGMLIVGYGVHTTSYLHRVQPYWLVKNSWGKDWGEKGYYRVFRGDGTCGVNKMATSAVVP